MFSELLFIAFFNLFGSAVISSGEILKPIIYNFIGRIKTFRKEQKQNTYFLCHTYLRFKQITLGNGLTTPRNMKQNNGKWQSSAQHCIEIYTAESKQTTHCDMFLCTKPIHSRQNTCIFGFIGLEKCE